MSETVVLKTTFQLRRDTSANWTHYNPVLALGEPGFETDTGKLKIGDGSNQWNTLSYVVGEGSCLLWGYYFNGEFWTDSTYQEKLVKSSEKLYIDMKAATLGDLYTYDGTQFVKSAKNASESVAGIVKLYQTLGNDTIGTISQAYLTQILNTKLSGTVEDENLILSTEALV